MSEFIKKIIVANAVKEGTVVVQSPLTPPLISGSVGDYYTQASPTSFTLPNTGTFNSMNSGRYNDYTYYSA